MDEGTKIREHEHLDKNKRADTGVSILSGNFQVRAIRQFGVLHPTEGVDAFKDGDTYSFTAEFTTYFLSKPGSQNFGATYGTKKYTLFRQDLRFFLSKILGFQVIFQRDDGSWSFYCNVRQFLFTESQDESQGFGIFGGYGITDDKTNLIDSFYSIGIGGKDIFEGHDNDIFGIGYFYTKTSDEFVRPVCTIPVVGPSLARNIGDAETVEIFYNFKIYPWLHITPEFQIIEPANEGADTTYVAGVRVKIDFLINSN